MKQTRTQVALLAAVGFLLLAAGSARAALLKFVWAEAQPPVVNTATELSFHDSVFNTDITLTALNGATFTAHAFDPSFPSLPSSLGPLGPGKEDFTIKFPSTLSIADILVTANIPVLDSAGDIIDAETVGGADRIGTEEKTATGVSFTEQLSKADSLDLSLTNFLFASVPEPSTWTMVGIALAGATLLLRKRFIQA